MAGALAVPRDVPLVVVEHNYLLRDEGFASARGLLADRWFLGPDGATRRRRLVDRHVRHGRSPQAWVRDTDEPNARLLEAARSRADLVVRITGR